MSAQPGTLEYFQSIGAGHSHEVYSILPYFAWSHLPEPLQQISQPFGQLAETMVQRLPDVPELAAGLRKLLEAKDCAVRAAL